MKIIDKVSVFGEIGIGQAYIQQKKNSSVSSRYDVKDWSAAYSFGGGLRYQLKSKWQIFVQYRYTDYGDTSFNSHLPNGARWEMINTDTHSDSFNAGVAFHFGAKP